MPLATNHMGDQLLIFQRGTAPARLADYPDLPLVYSCVVARHHGEVLFVHNIWRDLWELPAGLIEPGETPLAAGIRELAEESSQVVSSLNYVALALLRLGRDNRLELGTIYTCQLETLQPFVANQEISAIIFWDLQRPLNGQFDALSLKLVQLTIEQGS